jgi:hypothetical protein
MPCWDCYIKNKLEWGECSIYVRKHGSTETVIRELQSQTSQAHRVLLSHAQANGTMQDVSASDHASRPKRRLRSSHPSAIVELSSSDEDQASETKKRKKQPKILQPSITKFLQSSQDTDSVVQATTSEQQPLQIKRPTRRQQTRNRHVIKVMPHWTIKDIKVHFMNVWSLVPIYQRIFLRGQELDDGTLSLKDLNIVPGACFDLIVARENEATSAAEWTADQTGRVSFIFFPDHHLWRLIEKFNFV